VKNTDHLPIKKGLKKDLNKKLNTFREYRFSEGIIESQDKKSKDFFGFLFKEYDSMNDLVKDIF